MLNWNDYRNQILARVGEIGKLTGHREGLRGVERCGHKDGPS